MRCACGREIENSGSSFTTRTYDEKSKIIYEVCIHGIVTINEIENKNEIE